MAQRYMVIPPGLYEIEIAPTGKVLDLRREDMRTVQQWERGGVRNQQWNIESAGGNYYAIRSAQNGAYLTIGEYGNGARVIAVPRRDRDDVWRFESLGNGEVLIVHSSGLTLDNPNGSLNNGMPLQVWSIARNNNQRFRLAPVVGPFARRQPVDPIRNTGREDFDEGHRAGISDYQADLSRNYRRHRGEYNRFTEREFSEGYNAGYDDARIGAVRYDNSLGVLNVYERRYYEDGYRLGQQDARYGNYSDYRRYPGRYNRQYEPFFRRGYEAGYNNFR